MKRRFNWRAALAALVALSATVPARAGSDSEAQRRILDEIAAGRSPAALIAQYRASHPSVEKPPRERATELRQLRAAEDALAAALRAWNGSGSAEGAADAYRQWQAAVLVMKARQQAITAKLEGAADGAAYAPAHRDTIARVQARQARIVALLEPLLGAEAVPVPADVGQTVAAALAALREVAAPVRREPVLGALGLPVGGLGAGTRAPRLTPKVVPAYATSVDAAVVPADSVGAPEGLLGQEIMAAASKLDNDYVKIYESVRNTTRTEWYAGAVKGALGTLRSGAGNDVDQASLLVALLRAASVPARYVHGVAEFPLAKVAEDLGLSNAAQVPDALTRAGVAFTPVVRGGQVAAVQVEHTWVTARVPYTNYRGAMVDASGKTWIPLDPSFKASTWAPTSLALTDLGGAAALQGGYLAQPRNTSFATFVQQTAVSVKQNASGAAFDYLAALGKQAIKPLNLSLLPNSLPYTVVAVTSEEARLAPDFIVSAHVTLAAAGEPVLAVDLPLYEAANQRISLSYLPASLEDHRLSLLFGGMDAVPLYLIKLRPQVALGGAVRALGNAGVAPGTSLQLDVAFAGPFGNQRVTQTLSAGSGQVLVMAGTSLSRPAAADPADADPDSLRLLDGVGAAYLSDWLAGETQLAALAGVRALHPAPSLLLLTNRFDAVYQEQVPYTQEWKGVTMDALLHPLDAAGAAGSAGTAGADFLRLAGLHGSSLESTMFAERFAVEAISADQALALAAAAKVPVLTLDAASAAQIDATDHADAVKDSVRNLVRLGYRVEIPSRSTTLAAWSGAGWRATDATGGASGYFISGGLAGGATATAPASWPVDFLASALAARSGATVNLDPAAVRTLLKLGGTDAQKGVAGAKLPKALGVVALDADGVPVQGVEVYFSVTAGGANFANETITKVLTDRQGIAYAPLTLGKKTDDNSVFINIQPTDAYPTRAALNVIDAQAIGEHGDVIIDAPFNAVTLPDQLAALQRGADDVGGSPLAALYAGTLRLLAQDQYGNPLSNTPIAVSTTTQRACPSSQTGSFKPGVVFNARADSGPAACSIKFPQLGDCGVPSFSESTRTDGSAIVGVIFGNDVKGTTKVVSRAGGISRSDDFTAEGTCRPDNRQVDYFAVMYWNGESRDASGANVSAALPGKPYKTPIVASVWRSEYDYEVRSDAGGPYLYFHPYVRYVKSEGNVNFSVDNGGQAAPSQQVDSNTFKTTITVGPTPGPNITTAVASNVKIVVPKIINNQLQEINTSATVSRAAATVFSVQPTLTEVTPKTAEGFIELTDKNRSLYQLSLAYKTEPDAYHATVADVDLFDNNAWTTSVAGNSLQGKGVAVLPRAQEIDPAHDYEVELVLNRGTTNELRSTRLPLPTHPRLITYLRPVSPSLEVDDVNLRACDLPAVTTFGFTQPVKAKLQIQLLDESGMPEGSPKVLFENKIFKPGDYDYELNSGDIGTGDFRMTLTAVGTERPDLSDRKDAGLGSQFLRQSPLPVGQVLVHGVKVRDGTLTVQSYPLDLPGRGPALRFQPAYTSTASGVLGPMGMNWTHNWDSGVRVNRCGDVTVTGADTGSVVFYPSADGSLKPAKGYHSTLLRNGNDFDFYSKDGSHYHYVFHNQRRQWRLQSITDSNGNTVTLNYDLEKRPDPQLRSVTTGDGRMLTFAYSDTTVQRPGWTEQHDLVTAVQGPGVDMRFSYDALANLTGVTGNGRSESFSYNTDDIEFVKRFRMNDYTDPNGRKTVYGWDSVPMTVLRGNTPVVVPQYIVNKVTTPAGAIGFRYDLANYTNSVVTNENGVPTFYELNKFGAPLKVTDAAGTTSMTWAIDDIVMLSKTDPRGVRTDYTYDDAGNQVREAVGDVVITRNYMRQDRVPYIKDRLLSETDRNGRTTQYERDPAGNLLREQHPDGAVITYARAANGDLLSMVDGNKGKTAYTYDPKGNVISITDPVGGLTRMERNARGLVTKQTDARNNATAFELDALGRILSRKNAKGGVHSFTYDAVGNKLTEKDELEQTTTWTWSPHDHPLTEERPDGSSRTMSYDPVGNKLSETDFRGNTTRYAYDGANRLLTRTEPLGRVTTYSYDGVGHVTSEKDGLGRVTAHVYNALGHRTQTTDAGGGVWNMGRDNVGNLVTSEDPERRVTTNGYDAMNRLVSVARPIGSLGYTYDKNGNRLTETDANGNTTASVYDAANRVTSIVDAAGKSTVREYDANGNLTKETDRNNGITLHSYDELDRKTETRDAAGNVTTWRYDALGNQTGERQPNGNDIGHTYDALNRLVSSSDRLGSLGAWDYDADGNKTSERDANGNATTHEYNALSQLVASHLPEGRDERYTVDLMGNRTARTDARGNVTTYVYDDLNRLTETKDALGGVQRTAYDKVGNKTGDTDPLGRVTGTSYDALNRPTTVTDALKQTVKVEYDPAGNKLKETDKRGIVSTHTYDKLNRLTSTVRDGITLVKQEYDANGNVLLSTDANGNTTAYAYDQRNLRVTDARLLAAITKTEYDSMGDAVKVIDPEQRVTTSEYDQRRRLLKQTNNAGESTSHTYDGVGHRLSSTRPLGNSTSATWDAAGRLKTVTDAFGTTTYGYDKSDNHVSYVDALKHETRFEFDALNRRTKVRYPDNATESFGYDAAGNMLTHTDANGIVLTRTYDVLNREATKHFSASDDGWLDLVSSYDANNNLVKAEQKSETASRVTLYAYDNFDRQISNTDPFGAKAVSSYDHNGNKTSLLTQDKQATSYVYDALNRLTWVVGLGRSTAYAYDKSGLQTRIDYNNGVSSTTTYDAAPRVKSVVHAKGAANLSRIDYEYDANGNRSRETINRTGGAQVTTYGYDAGDRLVLTKVVDPQKTVTTDYGLDALANRLSETVGTQAGKDKPVVTERRYTYGPRNELQTMTDAGGTTTLSYDPEGNLLQKQIGSDLTVYGYNASDNLISVARNGTTLGRYGNNYLGLRVEKEAKDPLQPGAPPVLLRTLWDGRNAFQDSAADGAVVMRYDHDGRHPVSMWSRDDGVQALHWDALGSIVATTDASGALKSEIVYDAFGNVTVATGLSANKFGYTGHQMDKESGLVYFQARYYDPQLGRFITQDPFEGDWNAPLSLHHYLYAYANPTVYVDLNGYESVSTMIDNGAAHCGTFSCAGWALLKATYIVGSLGFASVHDPVRDAYDQGRISGKQYAVGTAGAGAVAAINLGTLVTTGGTATGATAAVGTSVVNRIVGAGVTGAAVGLATDSVSQATHVAAGIQDEYSPMQGVEATATGAAFGLVGSAVVEGGTAFGRAVAARRQRVTEAPATTPPVPPVRTTVEPPAQTASEKNSGPGVREAAESERAASSQRSAEPARDACPCCFAAGTPILTQNGVIPIEDVRQGDLVASRSDEDGTTDFRPVTALIETHDKLTYRLTIRTAQGGVETFVVTDNHPFRVVLGGPGRRDTIDAEWVESAKLVAGTTIQTHDGVATVESLVALGEAKQTYNFTVADFHTYFVGKEAVWVHNQCSCALADKNQGASPAEASGKVKFKRWKRGDAIDKPLPNGEAPNWDTVRSRYWKNRYAASKNSGEFNAENLERMASGNAPQDLNRRTGEFESRELHHVDPQRNNGSNGPLNLREVTPDQHRAMDKYRK